MRRASLIADSEGQGWDREGVRAKTAEVGKERRGEKAKTTIRKRPKVYIEIPVLRQFAVVVFCIFVLTPYD